MKGELKLMKKNSIKMALDLFFFLFLTNRFILLGKISALHHLCFPVAIFFFFLV